MRTVTFFEEGDKVKFIEDWRYWEKGEIAIVEKTSWERGFGSNQFLTIKSETNTKAMNDVRTVYAYLCEFVS